MEASAADHQLPADAGGESDFRIGVFLRFTEREDPLDALSAVKSLGLSRTVSE
jgi:hypothetical protein